MQSNVLPGYWLVVQDAKLGPSLRLSHDERGQALFLTAGEADAQRIQADAQRIQEEAAARQAAEARVRELEAELLRRQG